MKTAPIGKWHPNDFIKGLIVAVISALITGLITSIQQGHLLPDVNGFKQIAGVGLIAGLGYLGKNLGTNSNDQFLTKEPNPDGKIVTNPPIAEKKS